MINASPISFSNCSSNAFGSSSEAASKARSLKAPHSLNPSNHGLSEEQLPLMSPEEISAEGKEGAEGVSKTQPVIRGEDDPHWGPRATTDG